MKKNIAAACVAALVLVSTFAFVASPAAHHEHGKCCMDSPLEAALLNAWSQNAWSGPGVVVDGAGGSGLFHSSLQRTAGSTLGMLTVHNSGTERVDITTPNGLMRVVAGRTQAIGFTLTPGAQLNYQFSGGSGTGRFLWVLTQSQ